MNGIIVDCIGAALAWSVFLGLHSALISVTVTGYMKRKLGERYRCYRMMYNAISILTLVPVVWYSARVKGAPFFAWDGYLAVIKWALFAGGVLLFWAGSRHYSFSSFLGLRQIREGSRHGLMNGSGRLDDSGILGAIRHPYYAGVILLFWAADLDATKLVINLVVTVYVFIGTILEERKLELEFGGRYRDYAEKVSMLVPWKWLKRNLGRQIAAGSYK